MHGINGITGAAPIWHDIMAHSLAGTADSWPAVPDGLEKQTASDGDAYFLPGTDETTGMEALMSVGEPLDSVSDCGDGGCDSQGSGHGNKKHHGGGGG
jgi:hypothetical protein